MQESLSKPKMICYEKLSSFSGALRHDGLASSYITGLTITKKSEVVPISAFAVTHLLPRLSYLSIKELDLAREHQSLGRAPIFYSVRRLHLHFKQSCQLSQLIRFINSFPSISSLGLSFAFNKLGHNGQVLPKPVYLTTRSLTWLRLDLKPGVQRLVDWLLKAKPLLTKLKTLILYAWDIDTWF